MLSRHPSPSRPILQAWLPALLLAASPARAEIRLEVLSRCALPAAGSVRLPADLGQGVLGASDTEGQVSRWTWTLLEGPAAGTLRPLSLGRVAFPLPQVEHPTTFHVHVADAHRPERSATLAVEVLPALKVNLPGPLVSGVEAELTATRAGIPVTGAWRSLDPDGGSLRQDAAGRTFYRAPEVALPSSFRLRLSTTEGRPDFSVADLRIQVRPRITPGASRRGLPCTTLVSGNSCRLTADLAAPQPAASASAAAAASAGRAWVWDVLEADGGTVRDGGPQKGILFTASYTSRARKVHLRVTDPVGGYRALLPLDIVPQVPGMRDEMVSETIMAERFGADWMAPAPALRAFDDRALPPRFFGDWTTAWVEALCPVPPSAGQEASWLVATPGRLDRLALDGRSLGHWNLGHIAALALSPVDPHRLAYVNFVDVGDDTYGAIWTLDLRDPLGTRRMVAGGAAPPAGPGQAPEPGTPGLQVRVGLVQGLVVAPDGAILYPYADGGIARLGTDGRVTFLARDSGMQFGGLLQVPGDRDLLAFSDDGLFRVTPEGQVRTELGRMEAPGGQDATFAARLAELDGQVLAPGTGCLVQPMAIQAYRGRIFILDNTLKAILIFDPASRLLRVLAGDSQQEQFRPGPVRAFTRHLPPSQCGALGWMTAMAIHGQGECLVGICDPRQALAVVELGPLQGDMPAWRSEALALGAPPAAAPEGQGAAAAAAPPLEVDLPEDGAPVPSRKRKTQADLPYS